MVRAQVDRGVQTISDAYFLSYISKAMSEQKLYRTMTMHKLLDELDIIECFELADPKTHYGEITKKQKTPYTSLAVEASRLV